MDNKDYSTGCFVRVSVTGCAEYLMFLHISWCYTHACQSSMFMANFTLFTNQAPHSGLFWLCSQLTWFVESHFET